ncbi:MAG: TIGR02449 family protein [Acidiferrobacterales bacterium]
MKNEQLKLLESRIDDLISACERLKKENHSLADSSHTMQSEHDELMEKTQQAKIRIKSMIERLKVLEHSS